MEMKSLRLYFVALAVLVLDVITKLLVSRLLPVGASFRLLPLVSISHSENTGIAFGLLQSGMLRWPFVIIAFLVSFGIFLSARKKKLRQLFAWGLILGGAFGNGLERLVFGRVTDFIDFHWWPAFNIADSALTIGVLVILFSEFLQAKKVSG
jgi:signal peptidase II